MNILLKNYINNRSCTILSPHCDDVAISLGIIIQYFASWRLKIKIITVFSNSNFGPNCNLKSKKEITKTRKLEENEFARTIGAEIKFLDIHEGETDLSLIYNRVKGCLLKSQNVVYFAPLGFGDNIDHKTLSKVSTSLLNDNVVLYEDLPYACGILDYLPVLNDKNMNSLKIYADKNILKRKVDLCKIYKSQRIDSISTSIEKHASNISEKPGFYAERLWFTTWDIR